MGLLAEPMAANAGLLAGDSVDFAVDPSLFSITVPVVAGNDYDQDDRGVFEFDFNAGANGDTFSWVAWDSGYLAGSTSFTLSSLAFDDSSALIGFDVLSSLLDGITVSTTATSLTVDYTSAGYIGPGTVLSGRYITTSSVPEPGTLALLGLGLAGLGFTRQRKASGA